MFGTFDGIHEGHRAFLRQARAYGDHLIVAVAPDEVVERLKHHPPRRNLEARIDALEAEMVADLVVPGDAEISTYGVVKGHRPDTIALGYDQETLKEDLKQHLSDFNWHVELAILAPYGPTKYRNRCSTRAS